MPMVETKMVTVRIYVEVDGHCLAFTEKGEVRGARFHGVDPRTEGYASADTLESEICAAADRMVERAHQRSGEFLRRAYPTHLET